MCRNNTHQIVCGKDLRDPDNQPVICAWSVLKMLHFLIIHNFNHKNVNHLFETEATWDGLLKAANVFDAVVEEGKRICDPRHRRFNNMLATEVRNQLRWARNYPAKQPLLFKNAQGSWEWHPSAHDMNTVYHAAAHSNFIPAVPVPGLYRLSSFNGNDNRGPLPPHGRDDPIGSDSESVSHAPTDSERDPSLSEEDLVNQITTILHLAADVARAESQGGVPINAGELGAVLEQVEQYRDTVRRAVWGWKPLNV